MHLHIESRLKKYIYSVSSWKKFSEVWYWPCFLWLSILIDGQLICLLAWSCLNVFIRSFECMTEYMYVHWYYTAQNENDKHRVSLFFLFLYSNKFIHNPDLIRLMIIGNQLQRDREESAIVGSRIWADLCAGTVVISSILKKYVKTAVLEIVPMLLVLF